MFELLSDYWSILDSFTCVIAIVALVFARRATNELRGLRARLDVLERVGPARAVPPPLSATRRVETPVAPAPPAAETERTAERAPPTAPASPPPLREASPGVVPPTVPASPQAGPGFEERLGTRWVVWVGGLTLALGGFF